MDLVLAKLHRLDMRGPAGRRVVVDADGAMLGPDCLQRGLEVMLNGVRFDGCRETDGTMLEAKGPGYAGKMDGSSGWQEWFTGAEEIEEQMERQSGAAAGRVVEWHFAEQTVADFFRNYAQTNGLTNIIVVYTPAVQP